MKIVEMNPTFKTVSADYGGAIWMPLGNAPMPKYNVTEDAIPGFVVQYFEQYNDDPPLTGAMHLSAELTYGNLYPDLILSSEKMMKRVLACLKDDQRKPAMYGCNCGFLFRNAIWSHSENTGVSIDDGWVFMLNRNHPKNARLNGCMKAKWMEANNG
jgi:hypothetical protein